MTVSFGLAAELQVLGVVGPTKSTEQYYKKIKPTNTQESGLNDLKVRSKASFNVDKFFPIKPKNLTPGRVKNRISTIKGVSSFAVIGTDEFSENWLAVRQRKLLQMNTPIFVIEAESYAEVEKLANKFNKLKFIPSHGDSIALNVGVSNYPFLVHSKGVFQ